MRSKIFITVPLLFSALFFNSCIFQNDPVRPNIPPVIDSFSPAEKEITMQAPGEKISFNIEASDMDGDELTFTYVMSSIWDSTIIDSILSTDKNAELNGISGGKFHVQARVQDGMEVLTKNWYVTVIEESNKPPEILAFIPEMESFSCLLGSRVEFRLSIHDGFPEFLRYIFRIDGETKKDYVSYIRSQGFDYQFMENGSYEVTGIVWDWEFGDTMVWHVNVTGEPDTIFPAPINDLEGWTGDVAGSFRLRWTATGDDGNEGTVYAYRVKTFTIPIITEQDWMEASIKYDSPEPGPPGTVENMTVINCYPGTNLYAAARAVDDFENLGPLGNSIGILVRGYDMSGYVMDAGSGEPVEGALVSAGMLASYSGADGYFFIRDLPRYAQMIKIRDELDSPEFGTYYDVLYEQPELSSDINHIFWFVPVYGMVSCTQGRYTDFLDFFEDMTGTSILHKTTIYKGWNHWPVSIYNPPMIWEDVDLQQIARDAMASWETGTGLDLFVEVEVADSANADCRIIYFPDLDSKHTTKTVEWNPDDGTPKNKEIRICLLNTLSPMAIQGHKIFAHELGHILGVLHSYDPGHLMVGMTTPTMDDPTLDELRLINVIYRLPCVFDSDWMLKD